MDSSPFGSSNLPFSRPPASSSESPSAESQPVDGQSPDGDSAFNFPPLPEQAPFTPPDRLPPSELKFPSFPVVPLLLGLGAAVGCGVALYFIGKFIYFYIVFNVVIGSAVAWGLSKAPSDNHFFNKPVLYTSAVAFSFLAYLVYNVGRYFQVLAGEAGEPVEMGFFEFILLMAEHDTFIRNSKPGMIGNFLVWTGEFCISAWTAVTAVGSAISSGKSASVPVEVLQTVLYFQGDGKDDYAIQTELAKRGWTTMEEQTAALDAARHFRLMLASST